MNNISKIIKERPLLFDGAMGTSIINFGLTADDYHGHINCNDYLSISRPDVITSIHEAYLESGCDIIETNSFGSNPLSFSEFGIADKAFETAKAAAMTAKKAALKFSTDSKPRFVSGSVGPGTKLPTLLQSDFDTLYNSYLIHFSALIEGGVDLFQIETCQDLLQIKSALAACYDAMKKYRCDLPVIVQVTVEKNGKMLLGTTLETVVTALSGFDLFALGLNCGTGPEGMYESIKTLKKISPFPVSVLPNAGFPELINGKLQYSLSAEKFGEHIGFFVKDLGVEIVGGCCGTTPEHIRSAYGNINDFKMMAQKYPLAGSAVCSTFAVSELDVELKPLIIGERANATGSKEFREALLSGDTDGMMDIISSQQSEGSHIIDLSVGYAGRNELEDMAQLVKLINRDVPTPLCIDSTDPQTIETALKCYGGKALINSINFEDGGVKAEKILTLAKKYGAAVIGLTIDETGLAETVERKMEVAERLINSVLKAGLHRSDLLIDTLTFTLGSGDPKYFNAAVESFKAIQKIKALYPGVFTVLGVSNCSYGLKPKARKVLNSVYLFHAVKWGLDASIFHAGKVVSLDCVESSAKKICEDLIFNRRSDGYDPLHELINYFENDKLQDEKSSAAASLDPSEKLFSHVIEGKTKGLEETVSELLETTESLEIINNILLSAMKQVGVRFQNGTTQLPFVLKSAEVVKKACSIVEPHIKSGEVNKKGTIVLATVKGDIHDIGKNLVDIILSNNGYTVHNIGTDRSAAEIAAAVDEIRPDAVGLSALLVKSALEMKNVAQFLSSNGMEIPLICGGAALTNDFVEKEVAPLNRKSAYYANDAFEAMNILEKLKNG